MIKSHVFRRPDEVQWIIVSPLSEQYLARQIRIKAKGGVESEKHEWLNTTPPLQGRMIKSHFLTAACPSFSRIWVGSAGSSFRGSIPGTAGQKLEAGLGRSGEQIKHERFNTPTRSKQSQLQARIIRLHPFHK